MLPLVGFVWQLNSTKRHRLCLFSMELQFAKFIIRYQSRTIPYLNDGCREIIGAAKSMKEDKENLKTKTYE